MRSVRPAIAGQPYGHKPSRRVQQFLFRKSDGIRESTYTFTARLLTVDDSGTERGLLLTRWRV